MRLSIQDLSCSYQNQTVVDGFNLTVGEGSDDGEIICLFGKSGCGKSTVLKAVAGLMDIDSGRIQVNGDLVNAMDVFVVPEKRRVGMIFQDYALFPHLTVLQNVAFSLPKKQQSEALELLALVNLSDKAGQFPHQLSGGQQQRVAIARALAAKPEVLLMDEPFSNIDHQIRYELIREIRQILKQKKISTIFVTHNKAEAFAFADKIAVMREGAVVQCDAVEKVYLQPVDAEVGSLLGKLNRISLQWSQKALSAGVLLVDDDFHFDKARSSILVRPQFMLPERADSKNENLALVEDVFTTGDSSYLQVAYHGESLLLERPVMQQFVVGDRVRIRMLAHEYCYRELDSQSGSD